MSKKRKQSARVTPPVASVLSPQARDYLSQIGRIGGSKSRRKLSSKAAKAMQLKSVTARNAKK